MANQELNTISHHTALEAIVCEDLTLSMYIAQVCGRENQLLGIFQKLSSTSTDNLAAFFFMTYVRPVIKYCPSVGDPIICLKLLDGCTMALFCAIGKLFVGVCFYKVQKKYELNLMRLALLLIGRNIQRQLLWAIQQNTQTYHEQVSLNSPCFVPNN